MWSTFVDPLTIAHLSKAPIDVDGHPLSLLPPAVSDTSVRLDANGMLAGQKVVLRFEVVDIQRGS